MPRSNSITDLLALEARPQVAAAMRRRKDGVLRRWNETVQRTLPDAEELTKQEVRDSIPLILEQLAKALEHDQHAPTEELARVSKGHGSTRFHQRYNLDELVAEYRILRRALVDEVELEMGDGLTKDDIKALDMGIDIMLHQAVVTFADSQKQELQSANEAQAKYLSFLSHDLRNSLNSVTLMLELIGQQMRGRAEFEDGFADLQSAKRSITETLEGMDKMLQAERLRKQAVLASPQPVPLRGLMTDIATLVTPTAATKGVGVEVSVPQDAVVVCDRELLSLVLQNLIGNAVKFSSRGTVRLAAQRLDGCPSGWRLVVSDEGPGIAPEHRDDIFGAFKRGETHGQSGVGLGLTIAAEAAGLLGTSLELWSELGKGTVFSFCLPAEGESTTR